MVKTIKVEIEIEGKNTEYIIETKKTKLMMSVNRLCTDENGNLDEGKFALMMLSHMIKEPKTTYEDLEDMDMLDSLKLITAFQAMVGDVTMGNLKPTSGSSVTKSETGTPMSTQSTPSPPSTENSQKK